MQTKRPKRQSKNKTHSYGFTIVELVVTIVIAGIIIPAVSIALTNLTAVEYQARDLAQANLVAQSKVESLRSLGYNSINTGTVDFSSELPASMGQPKSASYTVSIPWTGVKQIDMTITYTEYNVACSTDYRTYISELGVGQ